MNRRETLKVLGLASLTATAGFLAQGCATRQEEHAGHDHAGHHHHGPSHDGIDYASLSPADQALLKQQFFTPHELATVTALANLVIPADERSGNAAEAGVPEFIEFMMKDQPVHQVPMRGGLKWLDYQCLKQFGKPFVELTAADQHAMLGQIAYPDQAKPEMAQGVRFFNMFRDFVATGFFTSKIGIKDLEYKGNMAVVWQGSPQEVLDRLGVRYEDGV